MFATVLALVLALFAGVCAVVELSKSKFQQIGWWGLLAVAAAVVCLTIKVISK